MISLRKSAGVKVSVQQVHSGLLASFAKNSEEFFSHHDRGNSCPDISSSSLALILYTSGTTGQRKGVMLSHSDLLANTESIISYLERSGHDSVVNVLPFSLSFRNPVLLTHLAAGARVVIENRFMYPAKVVETLQSEGPSGPSGVPSTFYILLNKTTFASRDWSFLRNISQAGGGMRVETVRRLRSILPTTKVFIMYGQTEASPVSPTCLPNCSPSKSVQSVSPSPSCAS